jgi:hypothetical protein
VDGCERCALGVVANLRWAAKEERNKDDHGRKMEMKEPSCVSMRWMKIRLCGYFVRATDRREREKREIK